jgi:hypothetical protein
VTFPLPFLSILRSLSSPAGAPKNACVLGVALRLSPDLKSGRPTSDLSASVVIILKVLQRVNLFKYLNEPPSFIGPPENPASQGYSSVSISDRTIQGHTITEGCGVRDCRVPPHRAALGGCAKAVPVMTKSTLILKYKGLPPIKKGRPTGALCLTILSTTYPETPSPCRTR